MPPPENTWYSDYGSCGLEAVSALTHELKTTVGCTLVKNYPKPERTRAQKTIVQHAAAERRADLVRRFVGDEFLSSDDTERMKWTWTHAIESTISYDEVDILRILVGPDASKISSRTLQKARCHLSDACELGSFSCVRYLVSERGVNPSDSLDLQGGRKTIPLACSILTS